MEQDGGEERCLQDAQHQGQEEALISRKGAFEDVGLQRKIFIAVLRIYQMTVRYR